MKLRLAGLALAFCLIAPVAGHAAPYPVISSDVGVCDPWSPQHCLAPDSSGRLPVTGTFTPSGTQNVNNIQINGVAVSVGNGTTDAGTQRVTLSSDGTGQVKASNFPTTVDAGPGAAGASTLRTVGSSSTSTQTGSTITTHLTFQSVLAASTSRKGCLFVNTSADKMWVYFGTTGSATTSNSVPLPAGQSVSCIAGAVVLGDNIAATSNVTDGATFVVVSQ